MTTLSSTIVETVTPAPVAVEKSAVATPQPAPAVASEAVKPVPTAVPVEAPKAFQTANTSQPAGPSQEALNKEAAAKTAERLRMFLLGYI